MVYHNTLLLIDNVASANARLLFDIDTDEYILQLRINNAYVSRKSATLKWDFKTRFSEEDIAEVKRVIRAFRKKQNQISKN